MSNKKQTSVEWLGEKLEEFIPLAYQECVENLIAEALIQHKEELINCWKDGEGHFDYDSQQEAEWYYQTNFGNGE